MKGKRTKTHLMDRVKQKVQFASMATVLSLVNASIASADGPDVSSVTKPLDNLKLIVVAIIGSIGYIILAKNVMEFAQAYQQQDTSSMHSALKGIAAGGLMAGISTVLTILQFTNK